MQPIRNVVGIQIGLVSFLDEGVNQVLDTLQETARVNLLLPSVLSWSRGNAGRATEWFPDHGKAEPDHLEGGAQFTVHPEYYAGTVVRDFAARDPLYQGVDYLELILPEARRRGIQVMPYYCETAGNHAKHINVKNHIHLLEIDVWGRKAYRPCVNNPDYRAWMLSHIEDLFRSYDVDGYVWGIERRGALFNMVEGDLPTCFCLHCRSEAHRRGIDTEAARQGYLAMWAYMEKARSGGPMTDGYFVEFLRVLVNHPAILQWEKLWSDSHKSLYKEVYGTVKWLKPEAPVGMHLWQQYNTFNPFLKAQYDLQDLANCADFIKPVLYHDAAGPRMHKIVANYCKTIMGDATPQGALQALYALMDLDEAPYDQLPHTSFSPAYVEKETARLVRAYDGKVRIYPGLGVGVQGTGEHRPAPASIEAGIAAAYAGGATGIVISRNYSEATLENLRAVGRALDSLGIGETVPEGLSKVKVSHRPSEPRAKGSDKGF